MLQRLTYALLGLLLCHSAHANVRQAPEAELRQLLQQTVIQADSFQDRFDAEVWLLDMSTRMRRYIPNAEERLSFLRLVHREASKAGLRPDLVIALIHAESHFDRFAISSVGAQGMMQVMPFWSPRRPPALVAASWPARPQQPPHPRTAPQPDRLRGYAPSHQG